MKQMSFKLFFVLIVCLTQCYSDWNTIDLSANLGVNLDDAWSVASCLNNSNQAVVSWADDDGTSKSVRAATYDGSSWNTNILSTQLSNVSNLTCCLNEAGQALVCWIDQDVSSDYHVRTAIFDGISWITYDLDVLSGLGSLGNLTCCFNESNRAVVSWVSITGPVIYLVRVATYDSVSWKIYDLKKVNNVNYLACCLNNSNQALVSYSHYDLSSMSWKVVAATFTFGSTIWNMVDLGIGSILSAYVTCCLNESNQAVVSWADDNGASYHAKAATFDGFFWTPVNLHTSVGGTVSEVTCCLNESNQAVVSWSDCDGTGCYARAANFDGSFWNTNNLLANTYAVFNVTCCLNESGRAIVSWIDQDTSTSHYYHVQAATYNGLSWTTTDLGANTFDAFDVNCCLNESNEAVVSWADQDSTAYYFHVQAANFNGVSWSTTTDLTANLISNLTDVYNVTCCLNGLGQAVVSWADYDGIDYYARAANFNGSSWNTADLNANSDNVGEVSCCLNEFNQALVSWFDRDTSPNNYYHVQAATFSELLFPKGKKGSIKELLLQRDCVNELSWNSIAAASEYRVYWNSYSLQNLIFEGNQLYFFHHGAESPSTYYFTWVDRNGIESAPITILMP